MQSHAQRDRAAGDMPGMTLIPKAALQSKSPKSCTKDEAAVDYLNYLKVHHLPSRVPPSANQHHPVTTS